MTFQELGHDLKLRRINKGLTMKDIACYCKVSHNYISKIEKGLIKNPSDVILERLSEILEIDSNLVFACFGKIPNSVRDLLLENNDLIKVLNHISNKKDISDTERSEFISLTLSLYKEFCQEKGISRDLC